MLKCNIIRRKYVGDISGGIFILSMVINCGVLYVAVKLMHEKPGIPAILIIGFLISLVGLLPGFYGAIAASIITLILLYRMCDFNILPEGLYILSLKEH